MFYRLVISIVQVISPFHRQVISLKTTTLGQDQAFPEKKKLINRLRAKAVPLTGFLSLKSHPPKTVEKTGQAFTLNKNYIKPCFCWYITHQFSHASNDCDHI